MSQRSVVRTAGGLGLVFLAWLCFCSLESSIWVFTTPGHTITAQLALVTVSLSFAWTLVSLVVARWHASLRRWTSSLALIALAHLPTLALGFLADYGGRQLVELLRHSGAVLPFWAQAIWTGDQIFAAYLLIIAVVETLAAARALRDREQRNRRLESLLDRARLDFLEAQLQPHFLFNALSAVSEHATTKPTMAGRVIDHLVAGLRVPLDGRRDEVTLEEELAGLDSYLDIQRMRFSDWLTISYSISPAARGCCVPRFVLQPLAENAIRHGLTDRTTRGAIEISAVIEGEDLRLRVSDNGVGLPERAEARGYGIGLTNVRQRLDILYGERAAVRLLTLGAGTTAELRIPARRAAPAGSDAGRQDRDVLAVAPAGDVRALRKPALLRHPAVAIPVVWAACGLIWTQQAYLYVITGNPLPVRTWLGLARLNFAVAALWAALTPPLLAVGGRLVGRVRSLGWRIAAAGAACAVATVVHVVLFWQLINPTAPLLSEGFQATAAVDLIIAVVIIAIAQRVSLLRWLRTSDAEAVSLAAELAEQRRRAESVQTFPPVIVASLEIIRSTVRRDPARAERQITLLGDYLRAALESTAGDDAGAVTNARLAAARSALQAAGALRGSA